MKKEMYILWDFLLQIKKNLSNSKGDYGFYYSWLPSSGNNYSGITKGCPPRRHSNGPTDLYMQIQNRTDLETIVITNIPKEVARLLEAFCIKYSAIYFGLHKPGATEIIPGKALNKKHEYMWEKQIPELIVNGNNIECLIRRQTYNYQRKGVFCNKGVCSAIYRRDVEIYKGFHN